MEPVAAGGQLNYGMGRTRGTEVGILVVGPESRRVSSLCTALKNESDFFSIVIMRCLDLPLSAAGRARLYHYDMVLFVVDLFRPQSLESARRSLRLVDVHYRCGGSCIVAVGGDAHRRTVPVEAIHGLADNDIIPIVFGSSDGETAVASMAHRILRLTEKATQRAGLLGSPYLL